MRRYSIKTDMHSFVTELVNGKAFEDNDSGFRIVLGPGSFEAVKGSLLKLNDEILSTRLNASPCREMLQNRLGQPVQTHLLCEIDERVRQMKVSSVDWPEHSTIIGYWFLEKI